MKKEYMKPFVEIVEIEFQNLICASTTESGASVKLWNEDKWPDDTEDSDS